MGERIYLQIIEGRLILIAIIECESLRISKQIVQFVVDTGSSDSFLSELDVKRLKIPIKDKEVKNEIDFGGSRFKQVSLPKINLYLLKENKETDLFKINLSALKTTKLSEKKIQIAQTLSSILGIDFLKEQKLSLHIILSENLAYLES